MSYIRTVVYVEADTSKIWCEDCVNMREQNNTDEDGYPLEELFWTMAYLSVGDQVACTQCEAVVIDIGGTFSE